MKSRDFTALSTRSPLCVVHRKQGRELGDRLLSNVGLPVVASGKLNAPLSVTGYSLGRHLAPAFKLLHPLLVAANYTFNGAGVGTLADGMSVTQAMNVFSEQRALGGNADLFTQRTYAQSHGGQAMGTNVGQGDDVVHAGAGNDIVNAGGDDDVVFAGSGNDDVAGYEGADFIDGGVRGSLLREAA